MSGTCGMNLVLPVDDVLHIVSFLFKIFKKEKNLFCCSCFLGVGGGGGELQSRKVTGIGLTPSSKLGLLMLAQTHWLLHMHCSLGTGF